ncbi:ATP-binding protein [Streptomyces sp. NBC_01795]|nr:MULTISPECIES: AAA family ATPase [unclassified Streptomyces]WSA97076.1 ATP-binding protein [Streptomyces sp. NBC_01795]WSB81501.1 ATP-binding protein [Streptomyces sp. NBC_01775]WSS17738.1 ATP-binding protein [Streptomyces sp. NBC_01186]WSS46489.1 ATP-binding protein [Streptomyces sp. NBC_01187]
MRGADTTARGPDAATATRADVPHDLRGTVARHTLRYPAGDVVVVSGLPGGGKSTLIRAAVPARADVIRVDSQDTRERWERRLPGWLPYGVYRPLVRIAHYAGLRRALASGAAVVVHDCGTQSWVRRWLARDAVRRGRALHLLLLDVTARDALSGQAERGRGVSGYAFRRHLRAVRRLRAAAQTGRLPGGCVSSVLLDRGSAQALREVIFTPASSADVPSPVPGARAPAVPPPGSGEGAVDGDTSGKTPDATGVSGPVQG